LEAKGESGKEGIVGTVSAKLCISAKLIYGNNLSYIYITKQSRKTCVVAFYSNTVYCTSIYVQYFRREAETLLLLSLQKDKLSSTSVPDSCFLRQKYFMKLTNKF
jgi:hypothetical protein